MTLVRYVRRSTPPFDAGWFDAEHIAIQRALNATEDAVDVLVANATAVPFTARLTADVTNGSLVFSSVGLSFPVLIGQSWSVRWVLWMAGDTAPHTAGADLRVNYPTVGAARGMVVGGGTSSASPLALGTVATGNTSAVDADVVVEASFDGFSVNGTVDLQFVNHQVGQTYAVRRTSAVLAFRTN